METTYKFFSGFASTRARLALLATAILVAAVAAVTPAVAAVTTLSMGIQTGTPLTAGTPGSATYDLTLTRNSSYPGNSSIVNWSTAGLPTGATATFAPVGGWTGTTRAYRMTVTTTAATPAGPLPDYKFNFTATATPSLSNQGIGSATGSLAVLAPVQAAQTISFGPIANRTVGDPPFTVSATASSGLPVILNATGDCGVTGVTVTLSTPATLPGSCTITANQAGSPTNFLPATPVVQTFSIAAATPPASGTIDLFAKGATVVLAGQSVPVWGYTTTDGAALTQPGGAPIVVTQGDTVTVALHNQLPEVTGLLFQGQVGMVPDTTGTAPGTTRTYTFRASEPGTFLYEAALLPNAQHQAAMGLHGALIVRPLASATQAYTDAATAFNNEAVLVLSEIDPALNNAANPAAFDMRNFAPKYFLINGKVYPNTDAIPLAAPAPVVAPGNKVLLRYVNAGAQHHSMAVLGLRQNFVAKDGSLLPTLTHNVAAETLAPGQTGDAIATVPATAADGSKFAVYDGSLKLYNNGDGSAFGGMLTFVTVTGTAGTTDTTGPLTSAVVATPTGNLSATVSDAGRGGSNVNAAEYFLDATGANGTGVSMALVGTTAGPTRGFTATGITGNHTVFVHGRDSALNWGPFVSTTITTDAVGPTTSTLTLSPSTSNRGPSAVNVVLTGSASDVGSGGSAIASAEYWIDSALPLPLVVTTGATATATLAATIPAATVGALSSGPHTVSVRSRDAAGNWGAPVTATLTVNAASGPLTSGVTASPNPNNGAQPYSPTQPVVRVTASVSCAATCTTVGGAEGFIDTVGGNGTGFPLVPADGAWGGLTEAAYVDIPLATIAALSDGNHTIYVRGKEAAGAWGATVSTPLFIDKPPSITSVTLSPTTVGAGSTTTLTVAATDVIGLSSTAQYWIDGSATPPATPTTFSGSSVAVNTSTLSGGTHTVYVRVQDTYGNWSAVRSATVYVVQAVADAKAFAATGTNGTQTQPYNSAATSLLANDFPTTGTVSLVSAPVRIAGTGTATMALSCPAGGGNVAAPAVGGSAICTNGRFNVNLSDPGGNNAAQIAGRRGTFTFTYTITSGGATSAPATVTVTVN